MRAGFLTRAFYASLGAVTLACGAPDTADPPIAQNRLSALVVTTDFESGSYTVVDVESRDVQRNIAAVHSDLACRFDEIVGAPFIIERFGADAIDVINPSENWRIAKQYSAGAGTNPQDIVAVSPNRAYIARLGAAALQMVNPMSGAVLGTVDLSACADADGIPEVTRLHYRNGKLFALAARLQDFHPTDVSSVIVIDADSGDVESEVPLSFVNPSGPLRYSEALERLVIIETGGFSSRGGAEALDGIIETFDPETYALEGPIVTSAVLGGDIIDAVIVRKDKGYVVIEREVDGEYETALLTFNPESGTVLAELTSARNFSYPFMEVTPDGSELWLLDRTKTAPGIRIFDVETDALLTETPIDTGLPPFMLSFVQPRNVAVADAGDTHADGGDDLVDAGDISSVPEWVMEGTTTSRTLGAASCPVPVAPVLTVIRADEILRFSVGDETAEIETGISFDTNASAPDKWIATGEVRFDDVPAPYAAKVFARSSDGDCTQDIIFAHVYNVRSAYPPPAGEPGTTALPMDDDAFVSWASGYVSPVAYGEAVDETWRTPDLALGPAAGTSTDVATLGRGGEIVLTFDRSIQDDPGFDFAIFENSISDGFLDLAAAAVSTDGKTFVSFDTANRWTEPVGAFDTLDTADLEGLAGKYKQGFGQPFDLHTLSFAPEVLSGKVDLRNIRYLKLTDVVGDGSLQDSFGRPIYDPYPCTGSAGFDLDAVGVIHAALR